MPLLGIFLSLDQNNKYILSNVSIAIQSFSSFILFGALARFSVKQGKLKSELLIEKNARLLKIFCVLNSIILFIFLVIASEFSIATVASLLLALVISIINITIIEDYAKSNNNILKSRVKLNILLIALLIIAAYYMDHDNLVYYLLMVPPLIILPSLVANNNIINIASVNKKNIHRIKRIWLKYLKLNLKIFLLGFVTPISLYLVSLSVEKKQGAPSYIAFTQSYSVFSMIVFVSNIYVNKLLIDFSRQKKWSIVYKYVAGGISIPFILLIAIGILPIHQINNSYFIEIELIIWILIASAVFIIQSISSQILYVKNMINTLMIFSIVWLFILIFLASLASDLTNIWQAYAISFFIVGCFQFYFIKTSKNV